MAKIKNWSDNFNELKSNSMNPVDYKYWKWAIEESKSKGTLQLNVRCYSLAKNEGGYEGPTKNGFIISINNKKDLEELQKFLNEAFDTAKGYFED